MVESHVQKVLVTLESPTHKHTQIYTRKQTQQNTEETATTSHPTLHPSASNHIHRLPLVQQLAI